MFALDMIYLVASSDFIAGIGFYTSDYHDPVSDRVPLLVPLLTLTLAGLCYGAAHGLDQFRLCFYRNTATIISGCFFSVNLICYELLPGFKKKRAHIKPF